MLLYVNGDTISAGAKSINNFIQADDDFAYVAQGSRGHPDNIVNSWGYFLSKHLNLSFKCDAQPYKTNQEIANVTCDFLNNHWPRLNNNYLIVSIGWLPIFNQEQIKPILKTIECVESIGQNWIFFNTTKPIVNCNIELKSNYVDPYDSNSTFLNYSINNQFEILDGYPRKTAHQQWAKYLFKRLTKLL